MIPGPDRVIACPHCRALARHRTLTSGNTFGARTWSDGRTIAPMLPQPPSVVRCHACAGFYWLADADEVGTFEPWGKEADAADPAWTAAPHVQEPAEADYHEAIGQGLATDRELEFSLRLLTWWRRYDAWREDPESAAVARAAEPGPWRENLEALVQLFDDTDAEQGLVKAEALRELGRFAEAREALARVEPEPEFAVFAQQIRVWCEAGEVGVRELRMGG